MQHEACRKPASCWPRRLIKNIFVVRLGRKYPSEFDGLRQALNVSRNFQDFNCMKKTLDLRKVFGVILSFEPGQNPSEPFEMEMQLVPEGKSALHAHPRQQEIL